MPPDNSVLVGVLGVVHSELALVNSPLVLVFDAMAPSVRKEEEDFEDEDGGGPPLRSSRRILEQITCVTSWAAIMRVPPETSMELVVDSCTSWADLRTKRLE